MGISSTSFSSGVPAKFEFVVRLHPCKDDHGALLQGRNLIPLHVIVEDLNPEEDGVLLEPLDAQAACTIFD